MQGQQRRPGPGQGPPGPPGRPMNQMPQQGMPPGQMRQPMPRGPPMNMGQQGGMGMNPNMGGMNPNMNMGMNPNMNPNMGRMGPGPGMGMNNMGGGMPPGARPRPPMPMGGQMNPQMQQQMGGQMPMGGGRMGGPPPMMNRPPPNMNPNMGGMNPNMNMGPGYRQGPPPQQQQMMAPPQPQMMAPPPAPANNSNSIYGGMGGPTGAPALPPASTLSQQSPQAPSNFQPRTSQSPVQPQTRPAQSALRRENSIPQVRKEPSVSSLKSDTPPTPSIPRKEIAAPPSAPSPVPPRREPSIVSSPSRKEAPSPSPRKDSGPSPAVATASRKDAPSPAPSSRKEVISPVSRKESPSSTASPRKDGIPPPSRKPSFPPPAVPSSSGPTTPRSVNRDIPERRPVVDIAVFNQDVFNHDDYLTHTLATASEDGIRSFLQTLKESKDLAAVDLQENVYKNYNEFVSISQEISKLESDMQSLRGLLDDLKSASDNLMDEDDEFLLTAGIEESAPVVPKRMTVMVSSMSDLSSVWKAQMMALWEGIEGAQKLLPYHPKRHLIRESSSFVEVTPSTFKIKHPVHIVLMNDSLLIATRKRKTATQSKFKLLSERCWSLTEITIEDLKDTSEIRNAIKITSGSEVFVYKTEKGQEKQTMLVNAKRSTDEVTAKEANNSLTRSRTGHFKQAPIRPGMPFRLPASSSQSDVRWLSDFADELDVFLAQREFEPAVAGVEKATVMLSQLKLPADKMEETRKRLDDRVTRLSRVLLADLEKSHITKLAVQKDAAWLARLGCTDQARDVFLANRSQVIRQRVDQIKKKKDPMAHIEELAVTVLTTIRNTSEWFELSFKDPKMSSGLIQWIKHELQLFAEMCQGIIFAQTNFQVIADCVNLTMVQCGKLREIGVDMTFVLDNIMLPSLADTIADHEQKSLEKMAGVIDEDNFEFVAGGNELGARKPITASMVAFYGVMLQFVNNVCLIGSLPLYTRIVDSVANLFQMYVENTIRACEEKEMSGEQRAAAAHNFRFVSDNFMTRVIQQLSTHLDRPIPELVGIQEQLQGIEFE